MIALILAFILGIAGIIPPEHFEAWKWAALNEFMIDIPVLIIIRKIIDYRKEKNK